MQTMKPALKPQKPNPTLTGEYRAIGSGAIVAALLYTPRMKGVKAAASAK